MLRFSFAAARSSLSAAVTALWVAGAAPCGEARDLLGLGFWRDGEHCLGGAGKG